MWKSNCLSNNGRVKNNFQTILKESYYGLKHCRKKGEVKLKFEGRKEGSINRRKHNSLNGMEAKTTVQERCVLIVAYYNFCRRRNLTNSCNKIKTTSGANNYNMRKQQQ